MRRLVLVLAMLGSALLLVVTPATAGLQAPGWQVTSAPPATGEQYALSCVTPSWCMSVGAGGNLTWDGQQWQSARGRFQFRIADLSCASRWNCMVVGSDDAEVAQFEQPVWVPVAMHWNGSDWTTMRPPVQLPDEDALSGVSCPAAQTCWLVGHLLDRALLWQNGSWSSVPIPLPAGATGISLGDIDCPAVDNCHALARARFASGPSQPAVASWNGVAWSSELLPDNLYLTSISCPTTASCVAVGGDAGGMVGDAWDGTTWQVSRVPDSPNRFDNSEQTIDGYEAMTSVSCWAANKCQAVGVTNTAPFHRSWNGTTWSVLANPALTDASAETGEVQYDVNQVDCYYVAFCLTAGGQIDGTLVDTAYMERYAP